MTATRRDLSFPTAELDRRFYAFTLDRLLAWTLYAAAAYAAYALFLSDGRIGLGVTVIVVAVLLVSLVMALLVGLRGATPGKAAVGLRVVALDTGAPIGVGPAMLRTGLLGVATLPTIGLGTAMLAWTSVMDTEHKRRGWHDHLVGSVVVDVRPAPVEEEAAPERPRHIVNLTAMRLVPASPTPPREVPARVRRSRWNAGPTAGAPEPTPTPAPQPVPPQPVAPQSAAPQSAAPQPPVPQPATPQPPAPQPPAPQPAAPEPAAIERAVPLPSDLSQPAPAPAVLDQAPTPAPLAAEPDALVDPLLVAPVVEPADRPAAADSAAPSPAVIPAQPPRPSSQPSPAPRHAGPPAAPAAPAAPARWSVVFDTGDAFVVEGLTLVGRNPEPRPGEPVRRMVALPSADMSLSKTHAQFQVVPDGALVVMDRGSTNGSILIRAGVTKELGPVRPATLRDGDVVRFGDREMRVTRES